LLPVREAFVENGYFFESRLDKFVRCLTRNRMGAGAVGDDPAIFGQCLGRFVDTIEGDGKRSLDVSQKIISCGPSVDEDQCVAGDEGFENLIGRDESVFE
jgi:hypothetical protein